MTTIIIVVVIILILIISLNSQKKGLTEQIIEKNEKFYNSLINSLNEPAKSVLSKLKEIYDSNDALAWPDLKQQLQIPDAISAKDTTAINKYLNFAGNENAEDFYTTYLLDIVDRFHLQYKPLTKFDKNEALSNFQVNLNANEVLYQSIGRVEWYEEKIVRKDFNYVGYNWRVGAFRSGRLTYTIDVIKDFKIQDIGTIFLTNKRIVFIGKHNNVNRSVPYDKILSFKLYQDGILLGLSNSKLPLIKFYHHDNSKVDDPNIAFITNDGMNKFVRVIERILLGTQDLDLEPERQ